MNLLLQQQQYQQQQYQQQAQQQQLAAAGVANGGSMPWLDVNGGGMGVPQQQQPQLMVQQAQQPQQQHVQVVVGGGGNQLAVAGAPAGQSTAESAQRGASGGIDFNSLAAAGDVTSAFTLPATAPSLGLQQQQQQQPRPSSQQTGVGASGGLGDMGSIQPTFMSNGAPVLLRGAGGGGIGGTSLIPSGNGMLLSGGGAGAGMIISGGGAGGGMMPTSQQPMPALVGGGLMPQVGEWAGRMWRVSCV
jgi:hypothetical protein